MRLTPVRFELQHPEIAGVGLAGAELITDKSELI